MSPFLRAAFFEIVGLYSLFSIVKELRTGVVVYRGNETRVRENPAGFYFYILCSAGFVVFAIAVLLNALGLIGDPFVWLAQTFPFLARR